ncbi:MAG: SPOR domain-containing protein [Desulfovibrionales bacterium]
MNKQTPGKKKGKKYRFEFSFSGLVSLFVFSVLIMVWMFILGVLVGRGYRPEVIIPQLAGILPHAEEKAEPPVPGAPDESGQVKPLKPEELTFLESLKKNEPTEEQPPRVVSEPKKAAPPKIEPQQTNAERKSFRYVYQVGAFREKDRAEAFRNEALRKGFNAWYSLENASNGDWYRVLVSFDGTAVQGNRFQSKLQDLGVKNALLRSKKPL